MTVGILHPAFISLSRSPPCQALQNHLILRSRTKRGVSKDNAHRVAVHPWHACWERGSPEPLFLRLGTSHERLWRAALPAAQRLHRFWPFTAVFPTLANKRRKRSKTDFNGLGRRYAAWAGRGACRSRSRGQPSGSRPRG